MRLFIAVTFPEVIKDYLKQQQAAIEKFCDCGNFTRRENFHLTVKFLGEVDVNRLPAITKAMDEAVVGIKPFQLGLSNWGYFNRGNRKLLWIGLQGEMTSFEALFHRVEAQLVPLGFPKETRKLTAHITMAREAVLNKDWGLIVNSLALEPKAIPVSGITLMESTRVDRVLTYIPLYEKKF